MLVRSDRRQRFDLPPDDLWAAFEDVGSYRRWWPWLRRFDAGALAVGEVWSCTVQPPLPWTLRFRLTIDEVDPGRFVRATIDGDIRGAASIEVRPDRDGSETHLVAALEPANALLRGVALVAAPMARFGHDWVIETGIRQFAERATPGQGGR